MCPRGMFVGFEVKTGKAVQNKHQKAFQKACEVRNGTYLIIRDIKDLKQWLANYLLIWKPQL